MTSYEAQRQEAIRRGKIAERAIYLIVVFIGAVCVDWGTGSDLAGFGSWLIGATVLLSVPVEEEG